MKVAVLGAAGGIGVRLTFGRPAEECQRTRPEAPPPRVVETVNYMKHSNSFSITTPAPD